MAIELLDFQQEAANKLLTASVSYYRSPDKISGRIVPFVAQLKAVTGAGKTPILTNVIGRLSNAIVLWTTKYGSVVDQTYRNLRPAGKYHHLLTASTNDVFKFRELGFAEWRRVIDQETGITILLSTVATWNSSEKDPRLNVHQKRPDWGGIPWEQLKSERKRPLWIVYDEAHNSTHDQVELLDELDPAGFFVASASPVTGKLQQYLTNLSDALRAERIVPVSTRAVVEAQLLKSTLSLADYQSSATDMLADVCARQRALAKKLAKQASSVIPKAIFVVEKSNIRGDTEARPVAIWKTLVEVCKVRPECIAVCTNTKDLPTDAVKVDNIDSLDDSFTHIIFNKRLQEGWDDPAVYICYLDGETTSATRLQQVIGRALRQPNASHFPDEELNTAHFFFNAPTDLLEKIVDELRDELRIYKDGTEPDFEPFRFREERKALPEIPTKKKWNGRLKIPRLQLEMPTGDRLRKLIAKKTFDFSAADRAAPGKAEIHIVSVKTGDATSMMRDLIEDMRMPCGLFLQSQIRALSRNCANAIHSDAFTTKQLEKTACFGSKALAHYQQVAVDVVREYENHVELTQVVDPTDAEHAIGAYLPSGEVKKEFANAAHSHYDSKSFNDLEIQMAKALDTFGEHVWSRNRPRVDYGIPLPIKSGSSSTFYPDFIWFVNDTVWCIDPTGKFILDEKLRTKLLFVPKPLRIALVTPDKYDERYRKLSAGGWSLLRWKSGALEPELFDTLTELLAALVAGSESLSDA